MMKRMVLVFALCFATTVAQAATLTWDPQTIVSPLMVERSATQTGTYETVATLPTGATSYILTPGAYGWYRVRNSAGPSNVVQFSLDLFTGPVTQRIDALEAVTESFAAADREFSAQLGGVGAVLAARPWEATLAALTQRVQALEQAPVVVPPTPPPASNLTVRQIDADHIEITCNGIGISTTGTGTRRVMECRH